MIEKSGFEKFMAEKSGVEAWDWKDRGWDVLQPKKDFVIKNFLEIDDMIKTKKKNKNKISSTGFIKVNWSKLNGFEG